MNSQNFVIGVLSTTSAIFLAALLIISSRSQPVMASGMTTQGGRYGMTVGSAPSGDEEFIYVIDSATERLVVYRFDTTRKQIQLAQGFDFRNLRVSKDNLGKPATRRTGNRRP